MSPSPACLMAPAAPTSILGPSACASIYPPAEEPRPERQRKPASSPRSPTSSSRAGHRRRPPPDYHPPIPRANSARSIAACRRASPSAMFSPTGSPAGASTPMPNPCTSNSIRPSRHHSRSWSRPNRARRAPDRTNTLPTQASKGPKGQVGTLGVAFGADAQLEKSSAEGLVESESGRLRPQPPEAWEGLATARHAQPSLPLRCRARLACSSAWPRSPPTSAPYTKTTLSLGEERLVIAVDLTVNIARSGIFNLSFAVPGWPRHRGS